MANEISSRPIHIPKDAYADHRLLAAVCLCKDWMTTRAVHRRMTRIFPERVDRSGELEVQRDRLDFATYARLLEKRAAAAASQEREYRLTGSGRKLCTQRRRDGQLTGAGVQILQEAVLSYSTANEATAAAQYYRGHSARPFLVLLRLLDEVARQDGGQDILANGVSKRLLADCISGLWTEDEEAIADAAAQVIRWATNPSLYEPELEQYIDERYGLTRDEYSRVSTNTPARLGEWVSKLGLVTVSAAGQTYQWNKDRERETRELQKLYGLSEAGAKWLMRMGLREWSLSERKAQARQYSSGEESKEHALLKKLVTNFADDPAVIGEHLTLVAEEYVYPTGDKADLVLRDSEQRFVAVEIEVQVGPHDIAGTLQAAKYREMLAIMHGLHRDEVRAALVAFQVADEQRSLARRYGIEVYEVDESLRTLTDSLTPDE